MGDYNINFVMQRCLDSYLTNLIELLIYDLVDDVITGRREWTQRTEVPRARLNAFDMH